MNGTFPAGGFREVRRFIFRVLRNFPPTKFLAFLTFADRLWMDSVMTAASLPVPSNGTRPVVGRRSRGVQNTVCGNLGPDLTQNRRTIRIRSITGRNRPKSLDSRALDQQVYSPKPPGVTYYQYRWYDPMTGRLPSRDPIGESGGMNRYGFVGNDSVLKIDNLGLFQIDGGYSYGGVVVVPIAAPAGVGIDANYGASVLYQFPLGIANCMNVVYTITVGIGGAAGFGGGITGGVSLNNTLTGASESTGGMVSASASVIPIEGTIGGSIDGTNPNAYLNMARAGAGWAAYAGFTKSFAGKACVEACAFSRSLNPETYVNLFVEAERQARYGVTKWIAENMPLLKLKP